MNRCGTDSNVLFFFNDTATTEIYTLSLHDALPISAQANAQPEIYERDFDEFWETEGRERVSWFEPFHTLLEWEPPRSEEHTSELQSRQYLVCRLLLEKKKKK